METVVPEMLREFPELKSVCDREFDFYGGQSIDPYPVFFSVLRPAAFAALDRGDEVATRKYFNFYERVASDSDEDVNALSAIELIEPLANDARRLKRAWPYMGAATRRQAREYAAAVREQVGKEIHLPG